MPEHPPTPALPPDRSALPALLEVEAWIAEHLAEERGRIDGLRAEGAAELAAMKAEAEGALEAVVVEARQSAVRVEENRARDRVSEARRAVDAWIEAQEAKLDPEVARALARLIAPPVGEA